MQECCSGGLIPWYQKKDLMGSAKPYHIYPGESISIKQNVIHLLIRPGFALVAYANRDSTPYKERYNIPEAETIIRGVSSPSPVFTHLC